MTRESENLETARRYLVALEEGAEGNALALFFTPDVVQEEFPNRLMPEGQRRTLEGLLDGARRGKQILKAQRFDVRNAVAAGDTVVLELLWEGTLAIPLGSVPKGGVMRAHIAAVLEFRDGKIAAQRNYDCYEAF